MEGILKCSGGWWWLVVVGGGGACVVWGTLSVFRESKQSVFGDSLWASYGKMGLSG
jgi:hypothetical protein